jgi:hypothetical protein
MKSMTNNVERKDSLVAWSAPTVVEVSKIEDSLLVGAVGSVA